ncbi:MAG: aminotransferase class V-fold PLP-dependent enzyme, partial [Syntrophomonas sp.]|nr:aminotransferase class V-fold PLP-dependent enzyme [Syntrophomonas sp.]
LTALLIDGLKEITGVSLYGPVNVSKQTAVLALNIEGMDCGELSMALDYEFGVVTRSGLHCAPLAHATIGTINDGACRFSPGFFNTKEEMEMVVKAVYKLARRN